MQSRIQLKRPMVVVNILLIACFFVGILFFYRIQPALEDGGLLKPQATSTQSVVSLGIPIRLKISRINIDAPIQSVGQTDSGVMGVPKGPSAVGWFESGPRPGEMGTAVLDGHSGWKDGVSAVFDNLHMVHAGDIISIEDEYGTRINFVVRLVQKYDADADASEIFVSADDISHLNLITCVGVWDKTEQDYSERLVVFADRE